MQRRTMCFILTAAAVAAAIPTAALVAGGDIDTIGADIASGDAPTRGAVTIDDSADLGAVPADDEGIGSDSPPAYPFDADYRFDGLGGPQFHATSDVTLPGGTYDFRSFTVDAGVTVRFNGATTLRVAGDVLLNGLIRFAPAAESGGIGQQLSLTTTGDLTIHASSGESSAGIVIDGADAERYGYVWALVKGRFAATAEPGSTATLAGENARGSANYFVHATGVTRLSNVRLSSGRNYSSGIHVAGDLYAENCIGEDRDFILEAPEGSVTVAGGRYQRLAISARNDVLVRDGAEFTGEALGITTSRGGVRIGGDVVIDVSGGFGVEADGDIELASGARVTVGGDEAARNSVYLSTGRGRVDVRDGAVIDASTGEIVTIVTANGIDIAGSVRAGNGLTFGATAGDVVVRDSALLAAGEGPVRVYAAGTIAAEGGTASITAAEFDLQSVTGGLDLDLSTLRATSGRVVAISNGVVKLRGGYEAARDIQIVSRRDGIDVAGATLSTAAVSDSISGFVRLATYASNAPIDASDATIRSGDSDVQSGDVLLQVAAQGGETAAAKMKVSGATAKVMRDGTVMTRIRGTLTSGRRAVPLRGSGEVTAGSLARRVFLRGRGGRLSGETDGVRVDLAGGTSSRANFVITLREPETVAGTETALRFDRAGLHAATTFRRPRAK